LWGLKVERPRGTQGVCGAVKFGKDGAGGSEVG